MIDGGLRAGIFFFFSFISISAVSQKNTDRCDSETSDLHHLGGKGKRPACVPPAPCLAELPRPGPCSSQCGPSGGRHGILHHPQQGPLLSSLPGKPHLDPRPDCIWVSPRGQSPYQVHVQPRSRPPRSTVQTQKQPRRPRTPETGPGAPALVWLVRSRWGPWETSFPGIRTWSRQGGFGRWSGLGAHAQQAPRSVWLRPGSVRLGVPSTTLPPSRRPVALTSWNHGSQPTCLRGRLQRQCQGRPPRLCCPERSAGLTALLWSFLCLCVSCCPVGRPLCSQPRPRSRSRGLTGRPPAQRKVGSVVPHPGGLSATSWSHREDQRAPWPDTGPACAPQLSRGCGQVPPVPPSLPCSPEISPGFHVRDRTSSFKGVRALEGTLLLLHSQEAAWSLWPLQGAAVSWAE